MLPAVLAFFSGIGVTEIIVILVVALIIFGNRLPDVAKSLGKGYLEFRRGVRTLQDEIEIVDADVEVGERKTASRERGDEETGREGDPEGVGGASPSTGDAAGEEEKGTGEAGSDDAETNS